MIALEIVGTAGNDMIVDFIIVSETGGSSDRILSGYPLGVETPVENSKVWIYSDHRPCQMLSVTNNGPGAIHLGFGVDVTPASGDTVTVGAFDQGLMAGTGYANGPLLANIP